MPVLSVYGIALPLVRQLRALGCEAEVHEERRAALACLTNPRCDTIIYAVDQLLEIDEAASAARDAGANARKLVLVIRKPSESLLNEVVGSQIPAGAILVRSGDVQPEELLVAITKQLSRDPFGLEKYLAVGTQVRTHYLTDSLRRGEAIDLLDAFLREADLDPRLAGQLMTAADEFVTNAFYNAPVNATGHRIAAHLSRLDPVTAPIDRAVELAFGSDGRRVGVSVRDKYGSVSPHTLVRYLARAHAEREISYATGGAGLGLITALQGASQLVFNIAPGRLTECIGLVDVSSYRQFVTAGKSFHVFNAEANHATEHASTPLVA